MVRWFAALLVSAVVAISASSPASAVGPVNPKQASWTAPLTNTDQSALIDLAGYNVYIASGAVPPSCPAVSWAKMPGASTVTVVASSPTPKASDPPVLWPVPPAPSIPGVPGQKQITVTAVDSTGVESACATPFPFSSKAPGVVSNLTLQ